MLGEGNISFPRLVVSKGANKMRMFSGEDQTNGLNQQRRGLALWCAVALIIGTSVFAAVHFAPLNTAHKAHAAATWTQIWGDDFNGGVGTGVDSANWLHANGTGYPGGAANWGTSEIETMTDNRGNVQLDGNGNLLITPIKLDDGRWTSGRIETKRTDLAAPAGGQMAVEASIQMPNVSGAAGVGYWPAFWMLGAEARPSGATNWPGIGEIDIMESVTGLDSVFSTLHCGVAPGGPCNEFTGIASGQHPCKGCKNAFHTYRVEIDRSVSPEQLRWYLDGDNFFTIKADKVDAATWAKAVDHGFFIILNVAMGGGFPAALGGGNPTGATVSDMPMAVNYVHVFTAK
jgi:beta-glucanase (GH16 family)